MEQRDYVRRLLDAYRVTPGTCGVVRLRIPGQSEQHSGGKPNRIPGGSRTRFRGEAEHEFRAEAEHF